MMKSAPVSGNDERKTKAQLRAEIDQLHQRAILLKVVATANLEQWHD